MPCLVPRYGYGTISYSFYSGTFTNVNLQTRFGNTKYFSQVNKRVIIYPNVILRADDISEYGLNIPSGYGGNIQIINRGLIVGECGAGKKTLGGGNGGNGGPAIFAGSPGTSGGITDTENTIYINNADGIIAGGGGGGARGESSALIEAEGGDNGQTPWFVFADISTPISAQLDFTYGRAGAGGDGRCDTAQESGSLSVVNIAGNVNIGTNNNTVELAMGRPTFSGNVSITGFSNTVYIPNNSQVNVAISGSNNIVYIGTGSVGQIPVSGDNNTIYYPASTMTYSTSGSGNSFTDTVFDRQSLDFVVNGNLIATRVGPDAADGGDGGDWGQNGGDASWPGRTTYYGGTGGNYIVNNSNVTWLSLGSVYGGVS